MTYSDMLYIAFLCGSVVVAFVAPIALAALAWQWLTGAGGDEE